MFFSIDISSSSSTRVNQKSLDQPFGQNIECSAANINAAGTIAYFLLDENAGSVTTVMQYNLQTNEILKHEGIDMPYEHSHFQHEYQSQRAVFTAGLNFAEVNIDGSLYGTSSSNFKIGYVLESHKTRRLNPMVSDQATTEDFNIQNTFTSTPLSKSYIRVDTDLEDQSRPVREQSYISFGITLSDTSMKTLWLDYFCPRSGQSGSTENAKIELQYSFLYTFKGVTGMSDI